MKILYGYRYGIVGGVSTQLLLRQAALQNEGIQCDLFFSQDNGLGQVLPDESKQNIFFGGLDKYKKLLEKDYDAVIVVDTPELLQGNRKTLFLDIHTTTTQGLSYLDEIDKVSLAGLMVPSTYSASLVASKTGTGEDSIYIVPNTLNTAVFNLQTKPNEHNEFHKPEFIWVGKLDQHKNWRLALVYARILKDLLGSIRFYVVGGYTAPIEVGQAFFDLLAELDISDSVIWLDRLANEQVADLYKRCAESGGAMLITSRDESFGMAAAESLLCGCPLITNDLPVFREVFPESPMVRRLDINEPEQFIHAVNQLRSGIDIPERLRMNSILTCKYGPSAFVKQLLKVVNNAN